MVLCFLMLQLEGSWGRVTAGWNLKTSLQVAAAPAAVYAVQNLLIQLSYRHLDALLFNLINQSKLMFTAIFIYLVLGKKQTKVQCFALSLLVVAACILSSGGEATSRESSFWLGYVPCISASVLSGFASSLSQRALQGAKIQRDSYLFSIELALYSTLTLLVSLPFTDDFAKIVDHGFFFGWKMTTYIPVFTNAIGGIIVGLVIKYAGGVKKAYGIISGILLTAFARYVYYSTPLTLETWVALPIVILSSYLHTVFRP